MLDSSQYVLLANAAMNYKRERETVLAAALGLLACPSHGARSLVCPSRSVRHRKCLNLECILISLFSYNSLRHSRVTEFGRFLNVICINLKHLRIFLHFFHFSDKGVANFLNLPIALTNSQRYK